ncbi:hypothetical protein [Streptomyces tanashiensis]|uniref:hypothetical protein n=1 Tax=Streptomyces tanashiensis TaxID=67367 RepID=UPI00342F79E5
MPGAALYRAETGLRRDRPGTYTLIATRAPDGHVVQLASSRPAGTVITWQESASDRRQRYELTDAVLSDGTYAAEPADWYR